MLLSHSLHFGLVFQLFRVHLAVAFGPPKYQLWFQGWRDGYYVGNICAEQIGTYWAGNSTSPWTCQLALDCIIGNTSGSALQEMSSSLVLLGLTPTMLSQLGPKLSESSMLSYRRPGLSFLLSMGAPTVFPGRIFTYKSPFQTLKAVVKDQPVQQYLSSTRLTAEWPRIIGFIEYVATLGAIYNIIDQSIQLGWRSVLSWACSTSWLPMGWVLLPGLIHVLAALAFYRIPKSVKEPSQPLRPHETSSRLRRLWESSDEFRTCQAHNKRTIIAGSPDLMTLVLTAIAQLLVVFQIILGTTIFSSCQFLRFRDAIPVIARYALSAIVCRFINVYELRGMSNTLQVEYETHSLKGKVAAQLLPETMPCKDLLEQRSPLDQVSADISISLGSQPLQPQPTQQSGIQQSLPVYKEHGHGANVPTTHRPPDLSPQDQDRLDTVAGEASTSSPPGVLRPSKRNTY
jgi:hypothetical protein